MVNRSISGTILIQVMVSLFVKTAALEIKYHQKNTVSLLLKQNAIIYMFHWLARGHIEH